MDEDFEYAEGYWDDLEQHELNELAKDQEWACGGADDSQDEAVESQDEDVESQDEVEDDRYTDLDDSEG